MNIINQLLNDEDLYRVKVYMGNDDKGWKFLFNSTVDEDYIGKAIEMQHFNHPTILRAWETDDGKAVKFDIGSYSTFVKVVPEELCGEGHAVKDIFTAEETGKTKTNTGMENEENIKKEKDKKKSEMNDSNSGNKGRRFDKDALMQQYLDNLLNSAVQNYVEAEDEADKECCGECSNCHCHDEINIASNKANKADGVGEVDKANWAAEMTKKFNHYYSAGFEHLFFEANLSKFCIRHFSSGEDCDPFARYSYIIGATSIPNDILLHTVDAENTTSLSEALENIRKTGISFIPLSKFIGREGFSIVPMDQY